MRGNPRSSAGFAGATIPGGRFGRGAEPPSEGTPEELARARELLAALEVR